MYSDLYNATTTEDLIKEMMIAALKQSASDIHLEPQKQYWRLRVRVDGVLYTTAKFSKDVGVRIVTALKVMADLDIAETRLPQDGSFDFGYNKHFYDIRMATCPTLRGEKVVLRILNSNSQTFSLENIGLSNTQQQAVISALKRPEGMILVTGPTGSGKTVTLYGMLNYLNSDEVNICSVEDPIEIKLAGINQAAIQKRVGLDFTKTLRAFLRQDPDIIMLGEIRDSETAKMAIKAAQTGHLVLATLHTKSAIEAITRLLYLDVSAFNIANSVTLVIAQRLVRRLCNHCRVMHNYKDKKVLVSGNGCGKCRKGYAGRTGVFEVLPFSKEITEFVMSQKNTSKLLPLAKKQGLQTLADIASLKIREGVTDKTEIMRVGLEKNCGLRIGD